MITVLNRKGKVMMIASSLETESISSSLYSYDSDDCHEIMFDSRDRDIKTKKLTLNGIELGEGLSKEEADAIHEKYGINFSKETV